MTKITRTIEYRVPCDDSKWSVSFTRNEDSIFIGLHFGDKYFATHGVDIPLAEFVAMNRELTE